MVYKIGFIGAHGVGKTLLADSVSLELKKRSDLKVQLIKEAAGDAEEIGLPINEETTLATQLWILHSWCREDILYSTDRQGRQKYDVLLFDRGPENYCYLENRCGENPSALGIVLEHLKLFPYNKLYRLPVVGKSIAEDNARSTNPAFQAIMDEKIVRFLEKHQIAYTNLPTPEDHDPLRDIWPRIVVNETLRALGKDKYLMRE